MTRIFHRFYVKNGSHVRLRHPSCVYITAQRQYTAVQKMRTQISQLNHRPFKMKVFKQPLSDLNKNKNKGFDYIVTIVLLFSSIVILYSKPDTLDKLIRYYSYRKRERVKKNEYIITFIL